MTGLQRRVSFILAGAAAWGCLAAGSVSGVSLQEKMQFADGLYRRGMYDLAVREYSTIVTNAIRMEFLDIALFRLGESQRFLGNEGEAVAAYETLIADYPGSLFRDRAVFRRAEMDFRAGRYQEALDRLDDLLNGKPSPDIAASAEYFRGLSLVELDRSKDAAKAFRTIVDDYERSPYFAYACMALAGLLEQDKGAEKEILSLYERASARPESPRQGAEAAYRRADLLYRSGEYEKSAEAYDRLLEDFAGQPAADAALLSGGWAYFRAGRYEDAVDAGQRGLKAVPAAERNRWRYLLANAQRKMDDPNAAAAAYRDMIDAGGDLVAEARFELAGIRFADQADAEVIELLDGLNVADDRASTRDWMLGMAWKRSGDAEKAGDVFMQLLDGEDPQRRTDARYQLGLMARDREDWDVAATMFRELAKEAPSSELAPDALLRAGLALASAGKPEEAITSWNELIRNYPKSDLAPAAALNKARAQWKEEKTDEAKDTLQALIKDFPGSPEAPEAHYIRGQLFEADDMWEVAEYHYNAAIRLDPPPALTWDIQFRRVAVLQRQDREREAAEILNQLVEQDSRGRTPPALLDWLTRWNLENEQPDEAVISAGYLVESAPSEGWKQVGGYLLGSAYEMAGKGKKAATAYRQSASAKAGTREGVEARLALGRLSAADGDAGDALGWYEQAGEAAAEEDGWLDLRARAYVGLGEAYAAQKKWDDAARHFMSVGVLFDDPELTPLALYRAALAFEALDRKEEYVSVLRELSERYPDFDRMDDVMARLEKVEPPAGGEGS